MQFLKDIAKDERSPPLHRSKAAFTRGLMHWLKHDREAAKTEYRRAIKFVEGNCAAERERKKEAGAIGLLVTVPNQLAAVPWQRGYSLPKIPCGSPSQRCHSLA